MPFLCTRSNQVNGNFHNSFCLINRWSGEKSKAIFNGADPNEKNYKKVLREINYSGILLSVAAKDTGTQKRIY
ncbi:hypothetical protein J27TS8_44480 [Robertmurraya siralis]|uniref:Uncharacterized protein n=1 Tax=Robertmurraya siralis TaxID=77777 RepID=A0A919WLT5_9BACI|nr:hypothetical protein J27TS8_44480 [Robertmurraya siralis]